MSRYEWEAGTLTLPSAAVSAVKKAVRDANNAYVDEIVQLCKQFWTDHAKRTRSVKKYDAALDQWAGSLRRHDRSGFSSRLAGPSECAINDAYDILEGIGGEGSPRQVKQDDLKRWGLRKLTNRDTEVHYGEITIRFDGRMLYWSTGENNHQVDTAHQHPVVGALFGALNRVRWTRATGGVLVGNDEYNRDSEYADDGANYITRVFGPLGEKERAAVRGF